MPDRAMRVPASGDAIPTELLTRVLCADAPGAAVVGATVTGGSDGTSSRRALRISYNAAGARAALPEHVFVKSAATLQQRLIIGLTGVTAGEAVFFNELRHLVDLRSPSAYYAASDGRRLRSMVVMEDLAAQGWSFPVPMETRMTEGDAHEIIEQLATYHAAFWNGRQGRAALMKLPTPLTFQQRLNNRTGYRYLFRRGLNASRDLMSARLWNRRDEIWRTAMRSLELNQRGPQTLLHQDLHPGNWLRDPDGHLGLYDWQCVAHGSWALDYSYAIGLCLERDDRHAWERALLGRYLELLAAHGVPDVPGFDEAFAAYRGQIFHAALFLVPIIGMPSFLDEVQDRAYAEAAISRCLQTIDDLAALDAL